MNIELKSDLFKDVCNLADIQYLLRLFSENGSDFYCDLTEINETDTFNRLISTDKELIEEYFNNSLLCDLKIDYTISVNGINSEFNILEAKFFFKEPFIIYLENNLYDGYFVDSLLRNFDDEGKRILDCKNNGWLKYGNGGGCTNFINTIQCNLNNYKDLPKTNNCYIRCFVLIDSDKKFPEEGLNNEKQKIIDFLKDNKIPYHILEKREIENYMPIEMLEKIGVDEAYLTAYKSLSPKQKDFFDVEKGFQNKNRKSLEVGVSKLYKDMTDETYNVFRKKNLGMKRFKSEFPKLFGSVTKEQLIEVTSHQSNPKELEFVLQQITKLL